MARGSIRFVAVTLTAILAAVSSAEAKKKKWRTSVSGHFAPPNGEAVIAGAPFSQEGWETRVSGRGKVSWATPRSRKTAVRLDPGCAIHTSATLEEDQRYFAAVSIYGWDGRGAPPCTLAVEDARSGKVYATSSGGGSAATAVEMRCPVMALDNRGLADAAVDGNAATDWRCEVTSPLQHPWLVIDLGETRIVGGVRVTPSADADGSRVKEFEVFTSRGSYNWVPLATGTVANAGAGPVAVMFEEPATNRYFKILCTAAMNGGSKVSLAEVEFLGAEGKPLLAERGRDRVQRLLFAVDPGVAGAVDGKEIKLVASCRGTTPVAVNDISMWSCPSRGSAIDAGLLGFRASYWELEPCLVITEVRPGKAAERAGLRVFDTIIGINGAPLLPSEVKSTAGWFMRSHESTLGRAVVAALLDGRRKIEFTVLRDGETLSIPIALPDVPALTDSFPYDCPMVDAMRLDMAAYSAAYLEKRGAPRSARGVIPSCYAFLGVLGARDTRYGPLLQKVAHEHVAEGRNGIGLNAWYNGAAGTMLCEYYLATGDACVLPWIEETLAYFPQTADYSKWGHAIYGHHPGSLPYGGKSLIAPNVHMLAFDALGAARLGLKSDTWDTIEAYVTAGWSDPERGGYGGQGYGHGPSRRQSWFRTGGTALASCIRGYERLSRGRALYLNDHHWAMRDSHAYGAQGAAWGLLGLAVSDPEGFRSIMRQYAWHFVLSWEPGYGLRPSTYHMGCSYMPADVIINGGYGAVLSAVDKGLHVTGATDRDWLVVPEKTYASEVYVRRDNVGTVSFRPHLPAAEIRYTLDGTEPTRKSPLYEEPIPLPNGGLVSARAYDGAGEVGPVASAAYGTSRRGWSITRRLPKHLFKYAFDGDPYTYFETPRTTQWCKNVPHLLNLQFPTDVPLLGLRVLPRVDNARDCAVQNCSLRVYDAKTKTTRTLATAEIPGGGDILLDKPITTNTIIFSVDSTRGDRAWSSFAEVYPISPDPEISWDTEAFGARMKIHGGYPVRYTTDGTIPDAGSPFYEGKTIKCGVGFRVMARVVMENGWMGKPVVYEPQRFTLQKLERSYYEFAGRERDPSKLTPVETVPVASVHCNETRRNGNFALVFTGTLVVLEDTKAKLAVRTHADAVVLTLDGKVVLDNRESRARPRGGEATVNLKRGNHTFRLEHTHGKAKASLGFEMVEDVR